MTRREEYIVCDKCGALEVRMDYERGEKVRCQECNSDALWLFADRMKAWDHAQMIRDKVSA